MAPGYPFTGNLLSLCRSANSRRGEVYCANSDGQCAAAQFCQLWGQCGGHCDPAGTPLSATAWHTSLAPRCRCGGDLLGFHLKPPWLLRTNNAQTCWAVGNPANGLLSGNLHKESRDTGRLHCLDGTMTDLVVVVQKSPLQCTALLSFVGLGGQFCGDRAAGGGSDARGQPCVKLCADQRKHPPTLVTDTQHQV